MKVILSSAGLIPGHLREGCFSKLFFWHQEKCGFSKFPPICVPLPLHPLPRLVACQSPTWMILRPSQLWPEDLFSTTSPSISPSGAPPLRGLHAYHIFRVYKKTTRGGGGEIPNNKKKDSSHTSHTTRGLKFYLILPVLKENKDKKRQEKGPLVTLKFCI